MTKFWRKKGEESFVQNEIISYYEWAVGTDFFSNISEPGERTRNLLVEIHKRSLAEQVLLVSWDVKNKGCKILGKVPTIDKPIINSRFLFSLLRKGLDEKRVLYWEDIWTDGLLKDEVQKSKCHTLLMSPLVINKNLIEALFIINYSELGDPSRVTNFISFISSVLALSLQNTRLYAELRKKNAELKSWSHNIEERIEEGTKTLLEKELQYYALFEGTNDGILVHDISGKIIEANKIACRLLGYKSNDLLNSNWKQLGVSNLLKDQMEFFKKVLKKEKVEPLETIIKKKDGSTFTAELSSRMVRIRGKEVIQSFVRDVSVRKTLEESLRESEEKYRILVESSLVGVFIIRNGVIQFVNSMFEEITGYAKGELIDRNFYDLIAPEDRTMVTSRETRRERGEDVPEHYEVKFIRRGGEKNWGEVRSCRVVLDGKTAILGNVIDISQRKKLEIQLMESQKMESIGTLAGGIAHDFNNLLGGILGYASLLLSDMSKEHPHYNDIYTIAETAKRAADLTNRLLAFARGGKYRVAPLDMNRIVQDVTAILSHTVDRSIAIETFLSHNLWSVKGDSQQIHQTILNICLNASDAMSGGGRLTIKTANVRLDGSPVQEQLGLKSGDYVRIVLSDTGMGMDDKTKSRIFEPFFTTKPASEGSGLGLAVVYGVVKNHGGAVSVDSELGKGTKVAVYLPRTRKLKKEKPEEKILKPIKVNSVLLVDDEEVIRQVGRRMLEKGGYKVFLAINGKQALDIYQKNRKSIDLVILDLVMPEMGGKETCRRLREIDSEVRIVFTSGYRPYDHADFTQLTNEFFIQKPFQTEVLLQTIRDIVGVSKTKS